MADRRCAGMRERCAALPRRCCQAASDDRQAAMWLSQPEELPVTGEQRAVDQELAPSLLISRPGPLVDAGGHVSVDAEKVPGRFFGEQPPIQETRPADEPNVGELGRKPIWLNAADCVGESIVERSIRSACRLPRRLRWSTRERLPRCRSRLWRPVTPRFRLCELL
jgi:hypothetical protein